MDAEVASSLVLLIILILAVISDIRYMKISNRLIFMGLILALTFSIVHNGLSELAHVLWNISFPIIIFYFLYLLGVIGAGDIKLFSVIGGFVNFKELIWCMVFSFVIGAIWSLGKMLYLRTFFAGIRSASRYFGDILKGNIMRYPRSLENSKNLIPFSVAIFLGLLCAKFYMQIA